MSTPRINVYECEYGCQTVTVDVDHGVTPFMIGCKGRSVPERRIEAKYLNEAGYCIGTGKSHMYPKGPMPPHIKPPKWEWALPTLAEIDAIVAENPEYEGAVRTYYDGSHLHLRPRTDREPLYHPKEATIPLKRHEFGGGQEKPMNRAERRAARR